MHRHSPKPVFDRQIILKEGGKKRWGISSAYLDILVLNLFLYTDPLLSFEIFVHFPVSLLSFIYFYFYFGRWDFGFCFLLSYKLRAVRAWLLSRRQSSSSSTSFLPSQSHSIHSFIHSFITALYLYPLRNPSANPFAKSSHWYPKPKKEGKKKIKNKKKSRCFFFFLINQAIQSQTKTRSTEQSPRHPINLTFLQSPNI